MGAVLFPLGETILADEIGSVGEELVVVFSKVVVRYIPVATSMLEEGFEIVIGISAVPTQMRVTIANIAFELYKYGVGVCGLCHTWDIFTGVSLDTSVTSGLLDCVGSIQTSLPSKLLNLHFSCLHHSQISPMPAVDLLQFPHLSPHLFHHRASSTFSDLPHHVM